MAKSNTKRNTTTKVVSKTVRKGKAAHTPHIKPTGPVVRVPLKSLKCLIGKPTYSRCYGLKSKLHTGSDKIVVNRYATSLRAGAKFPPLLVDENTNEIVDGNLTYAAMMHNWNLAKSAAIRAAKKKGLKRVPAVRDPHVLIEFRVFFDEMERIATAISRNEHGRALTSYEQALIIVRMQSLKIPRDVVSHMLSITAVRYDRIVKNHVFRIKHGNQAAVKATMSPILNGMRSTSSQTVTKAQSHQLLHGSHGSSGNPQIRDIQAVIHYLDSGTLDVGNRRVKAKATELRDKLLQQFPLVKLPRSK